MVPVAETLHHCMFITWNTMCIYNSFMDDAKLTIMIKTWKAVRLTHFHRLWDLIKCLHQKLYVLELSPYGEFSQKSPALSRTRNINSEVMLNLWKSTESKVKKVWQNLNPCHYVCIKDLAKLFIPYMFDIITYIGSL